MTEIQCEICFKIFYLLSKKSTSNYPLIKTVLPLNVPIYLLMALAAEAPLAESHLQHLK
jgi:hypothetical protein